MREFFQIFSIDVGKLLQEGEKLQYKIPHFLSFKSSPLFSRVNQSDEFEFLICHNHLHFIEPKLNGKGTEKM
jgi:hypothetical protein